MLLTANALHDQKMINSVKFLIFNKFAADCPTLLCYVNNTLTYVYSTCLLGTACPIMPLSNNKFLSLNSNKNRWKHPLNTQGRKCTWKLYGVLHTHQESSRLFSYTDRAKLWKLPPGFGLDDQKWHTVRLTRHARLVLIALDGKSVRSETLMSATSILKRSRYTLAAGTSFS